MFGDSPIERHPLDYLNAYRSVAVSYAWLANAQQREKRLRYYLVVWGALPMLSVN
jgi:hypothetical protein